MAGKEINLNNKENNLKPNPNLNPNPEINEFYSIPSEHLEIPNPSVAPLLLHVQCIAPFIPV